MKSYFAARVLFGVVGLAGASLCQGTCPADDALEDNDLCTTALPLGPGFLPGLRVLEGDLDYWRITVPPGNRMIATVLYDANEHQMSPRLNDGDCNFILQECCTGADQLIYGNGESVPVDVVVAIGVPLIPGHAFCIPYALDIAIAPDACLAASDDGFEPNESPDDPAPLGAGVVSGLRVTATNSDAYTITVGPGERLDVTASRLSGSQPWFVFLSNSAAATGASGAQVQDVQRTNLSDVPVDYVLSVVGNECFFYTLDVQVGPDPCLLESDDLFEDNDECGVHASVGVGTYPDLYVRRLDPDFYEIDVPAMTTVYFQVRNVTGPAALELSGFETLCFPFDIDFGGPDGLQLSITNSAPVSQTITFVVQVGSGSEVCSRYDMIVSLESPGPGTSYCSSAANTSGAPAMMSASGSSAVAANDLVLQAGPLPANVFGIFFHGPRPANGDLMGRLRCVGGPFRRSPVMSAGPTGILSWAPDLTNQPTVFVGATRNFQSWFRDGMDTPNFNLSNGLQVVFRE